MAVQRRLNFFFEYSLVAFQREIVAWYSQFCAVVSSSLGFGFLAPNRILVARSSPGHGQWACMESLKLAEWLTCDCYTFSLKSPQLHFKRKWWKSHYIHVGLQCFCHLPLESETDSTFKQELLCVLLLIQVFR